MRFYAVVHCHLSMTVLLLFRLKMVQAKRYRRAQQLHHQNAASNTPTAGTHSDSGATPNTATATGDDNSLLPSAGGGSKRGSDDEDEENLSEHELEGEADGSEPEEEEQGLSQEELEKKIEKLNKVNESHTA